MEKSVFDSDPFQNFLNKQQEERDQAASVQTQTSPTEIKPANIDQIAIAADVPANILAAVAEMEGNSSAEQVTANAQRLRSAIATGKKVEEIFSPEVLARAAKIGTEKYGAEPAAPASRDDGGVGQFVKDSALQFTGSAYKAIGSTIHGLGEASQIVARNVTGPAINAIFGTEYEPSNLLQAPANVVTEFGEQGHAGISKAAQEAVKNSTPDGDLFKPSTWTTGEKPSLRGYFALGLDVLGSMLPVVAASVATGGSAIAGGVAGALQGGGAADQSATQIIDDMAKQPASDGRGGTKLEQESAYYRELLARGKSPDEALRLTKEAAGEIAFLLTAPISGASGAATAVIINPAEKLITKGGLPQRIAGRMALGAGEEGSAEAAETIATRTGVNVGAGTNLDVTEGTFGDFVLGALGGGTTGAVGGAFSRRESGQDQLGSAAQTNTTPDAAPPQPGTDIAAEPPLVGEIMPPLPKQVEGPLSRSMQRGLPSPYPIVAEDSPAEVSPPQPEAAVPEAAHATQSSAAPEDQSRVQVTADGIDPFEAVIEAQDETGITLRTDDGSRYQIGADEIAGGGVSISPLGSVTPDVNTPEAVPEPASQDTAPDAVNPSPSADVEAEALSATSGPADDNTTAEGEPVLATPAPSDEALRATPTKPGEMPKRTDPLISAKGNPFFGSVGAARARIEGLKLKLNDFGIHKTKQGFVAVAKAGEGPDYASMSAEALGLYISAYEEAISAQGAWGKALYGHELDLARDAQRRGGHGSQTIEDTHEQEAEGGAGAVSDTSASTDPDHGGVRNGQTAGGQRVADLRGEPVAAPSMAEEGQPQALAPAAVNGEPGGALNAGAPQITPEFMALANKELEQREAEAALPDGEQPSLGRGLKDLVSDTGGNERIARRLKDLGAEATRTMQPDEAGRPADGKPIVGGDVFRTASHRSTSPYPKGINNGLKTDRWLAENALAEAEARGDDFNGPVFRRLVEGLAPAAKKDRTPLSPADRDSLNQYLWVEQPAVAPAVLKPLADPGEITIKNPKHFEKMATVALKAQAEHDARVKAGKDTTPESAHISDATLGALRSRGWQIKGMRAEKTFPKLETAGQFSDGTRTLSVEFDETGRWLEHFRGFDKVFDIDSRDWIGRPDEFAGEIERRVVEHARGPKDAAERGVGLSGSKDSSTQKHPPAKAHPKKPTARQRAADEAKALREYFRPGNIVQDGVNFDRVVAYDEAPGGFTVTVRAVRKDGDGWVDAPNTRDRMHSTVPSKRELERGPAYRAEGGGQKASSSTDDVAAHQSGTGSPAFRNWFGKSKVVAPDGGPLRVFHGTDTAFEAFDTDKLGSATQEEDARHGFFFSSSAETAGDYTEMKAGVSERGGQQIVPVYLSLQNPLEIDREGKGYDPALFLEYVKQAKQEGRDGLIVSNVLDNVDRRGAPSTTYVAFKPEQIKSVYNSGAWSSSDPRMRFSMAGKSPDDFVPGPDGKIDLGNLNNEQSRGIEAPIRLRVGTTEHGLMHIDHGDRLKQIQSAGYANGREMVADVAANFDSVYPGRGRALLLVKRDAKPNRVIVVRLVPDERGNFYDVETAIVARSDFFKNKSPVWEKEPLGRAQSNQSIARPPGAVSGSGSSENISDQSDPSKHPMLTPDAVRGTLETSSYGETIGKLLDVDLIVIHENARTLPVDQTPEGAVQGMTTPDGVIHLVAGNFTADTIMPVLAHEMFHAGAKPLLGEKRWNNLLSNLERILKVQSGKPDAERSPFWREAIRRVEAAGVDSDLRAEEMAAYAIEHRERAPNGVRSIIDNLIGVVKDFVLRKWGKQLGAVTPGQLRALALAALRDPESAKARSDRKRYSVIGDAVRELINLARTSGHNHQTLELGPAQEWLTAKAQEHDLAIAGMIHTIDTSAVRHIIDRHGNEKEEASRGQIAITEKDLENIPRALDMAQRVVFNMKNARGQNQIAYVWQDASGSTLIVEEVRVGRKRLAIASMRKYPGTINAGRLDAILDPHVRNASRGRLTVVDVSEADKRKAGARNQKEANRSNFAGERVPSPNGPENNPTNSKDGQGKKSRFSMADPGGPELQARQDKWFKNWLSDALTSLMGGHKNTTGVNLLTFAPLRPMLEELTKDIPAAKGYLRTKQAMDTLRNEWHSRVADTIGTWKKFQSHNRKDNARLMELMHESTLAQVDPTKPFEPLFTAKDATTIRYGKPESAQYKAAEEKAQRDKVRRAAHKALKARMEQLSPEAKSLYDEVRDTYTDMADNFEAVILGNMDKALKIAIRRAEREHRKEMQRITDDGLTGNARDEAITEADKKLKTVKTKTTWNARWRLNKMREQFETNRIAGPYFPLGRFGNLFATVRDANGKVVSFSRFESPNKLRRFVADMKKEGYDVQDGALANPNAMRNEVDPNFVADVEEILEGSGAPDALKDQVWQKFLERLPDYSIRKNRIHRLGRAGFNADAMRAFANNLFHGAHQLARTQYGMDLAEHIAEAREQAKVAKDPVRAGLLLNEMDKRHAYVMNPEGSSIAQALTSAAFVYQLSVSPAAAIVNLSQTVMLGVPILGAYQGGIVGASKELTRALHDFTMGRGWIERSSRLSGDEKSAVQAAYSLGVVDKTQAHDLAGVSESGVEYSDTRQKVMGAISWGFHHAERLNREVTFLAAYRLARQKGDEHGEAIDAAAQLTWKTHFDYQNTSRPRFMQHDVFKVAFVFRNYSVNMLFRLFRDTHAAFNGRMTEAERKEARRQLFGITGMLALNAGVKGVWMFGIAMTLASIFFNATGNDEDDPEEELHKAVHSMLGPHLGAIALDGLPGYLSGTDLTSRIGMPDLWFRSPDRQLEGDDAFHYWQDQMLGATSGMAQNMVRGFQLVGDGKAYRGIETMAPKFIKDLMRAGRFATEGVTTLKGDEIIPADQISWADVFKQAIGFTPAQVAEAYQLNRWQKNREITITDKRKDILKTYGKAVQDKDVDGKAEAMERVRDFNKRYPANAITGKGIIQSMRSQQTAKGRSIGGVNLNPKLRPYIEQNTAPSFYRDEDE